MLCEKEENKGCECKSCVCDLLLSILKQQDEDKSSVIECSLENKQSRYYDTIPFILQTPYGNPFFTWGKIGTRDCFITVFFKVIKVNCEKNCAMLQLLKPNKSIINPETESVEVSDVCNVDYVTMTKERIIVDLSSYSAVKFISPNFVKKQSSQLE